MLKRGPERSIIKDLPEEDPPEDVAQILRAIELREESSHVVSRASDTRPSPRLDDHSCEIHFFQLVSGRCDNEQKPPNECHAERLVKPCHAWCQ